METSDRGLLDVERFDLEPDRPLFHGLLAGVDTQAISGLSARDKVPYVLRILEPGRGLDRGRPRSPRSVRRSPPGPNWAAT